MPSFPGFLRPTFPSPLFRIYLLLVQSFPRLSLSVSSSVNHSFILILYDFHFIHLHPISPLSYISSSLNVPVTFFFSTSFLFTSLMSDLPFVSFPSFRFHPTFPFPLFASPSNSEASTFPHQLPSRQQVEMSYEWSSLGGLMRQKVWERATLRNTEGTIHRAASSAIIIHP